MGRAEGRRDRKRERKRGKEREGEREEGRIREANMIVVNGDLYGDLLTMTSWSMGFSGAMMALSQISMSD